MFFVYLFTKIFCYFSKINWISTFPSVPQVKGQRHLIARSPVAWTCPSSPPSPGPLSWAHPWGHPCGWCGISVTGVVGGTSKHYQERYRGEEMERYFRIMYLFMISMCITTGINILKSKFLTPLPSTGIMMSCSNYYTLPSLVLTRVETYSISNSKIFQLQQLPITSEIFKKSCYTKQYQMR